MKLTKELIEAGKSQKGSYSKRQLSIIGVPWPPLQDWMDSVIGEEISEEDYQDFLEQRLSEGKKKTVRWRFAKVGGDYVDINTVKESDRRKKYICIGCGKELIPVLGEKRKKHFRHLVDCECNGETYLHHLAKKFLKDRWDSSPSFNISFKRKIYCDLLENCPIDLSERDCHKMIPYSFDLKTLYKGPDSCRIEEKDTGTGMIPDLVLRDDTGKNKPMWLEVFVTHQCSEDKLSKGLPVIEFKLSQKNGEEAALALKDINISEETRSDLVEITFHNFKKTPKNKRTTNADDMMVFTRAALLWNGCVKTTQILCRDMPSQPVQGECAITTFERSYNQGLDQYIAKSAFAADSIGNFKYCSWCKYYDSEVCCLHKKFGTPYNPKPKQSYFCNYYRPVWHLSVSKVQYPEDTTKEAVQSALKNLPPSPTSPPKYEEWEWNGPYFPRFPIPVEQQARPMQEVTEEQKTEAVNVAEHIYNAMVENDATNWNDRCFDWNMTKEPGSSRHNDYPSLVLYPSLPYFMGRIYVSQKSENDYEIYAASSFGSEDCIAQSCNSSQIGKLIDKYLRAKKDL